MEWSRRLATKTLQILYIPGP